MDCHCMLREREGNAGTYIEYCPLHKAAPELLGACKTALSYRLITHHGDDALLAELRSVIQKAEGK